MKRFTANMQWQRFQPESQDAFFKAPHDGIQRCHPAEIHAVSDCRFCKVAQAANAWSKCCGPPPGPRRFKALGALAARYGLAT